MTTPVHSYRRPVSIWWWLAKPTYLLFVFRELSSIFIAWLVGYLVAMILAVGRGQAAYQGFSDWASSPWVVVVNIIAFLFVALHTATWFLLTPKAVSIRMRSRVLSARTIIAGEYLALAVVSAFVIWLVFA